MRKNAGTYLTAEKFRVWDEGLVRLNLGTALGVIVKDEQIIIIRVGPVFLVYFDEC